MTGARCVWISRTYLDPLPHDPVLGEVVTHVSARGVEVRLGAPTSWGLGGMWTFLAEDDLAALLLAGVEVYERRRRGLCRVGT